MTAALPDDKTYYGHSNDFAYRLQNEKQLHDVERELGIRSMLEHMKEAGWDSYQWRNSREGRCSFIELSGMAYRDYKRTESTTGIRHAVEAMLNRVQAISRCERTTGHDFTGRQGYDNGVLACRHCGFGGYASTFKRQASELEHWRTLAEETNSRLATISSRLGVHLNTFGQILLENRHIPEAGAEDGYAVIGDTDKVSFIIKRDPEGGSE
jgi:hypothetical protein